MEPGALKDFAEAIEGRFGHGQDNGRYKDLADVLDGRIKATASRNYSVYRSLLANSDDEWTLLAPLLTVPETYFFRLPDQFEALAGAVIPTLLEARQAERRLHILSAGCASGEEPYSIRILLNERFPQLATGSTGWKVAIDAFDLSPPALARARTGIYSEWSLRSTSAERRQANFVAVDPRGKLYQLQPAARHGVSFFQRNLLDPVQLSGRRYDVIFCRNVLIYLSPQAIKRAIVALAEQLLPGGYLFLGPAESLRGLTEDFVLCQTHEVFYYRRKQQAAPLRTTGPQASYPALPDTDDLPCNPLPGTGGTHPTWFESIQNSSRRLARLVRREEPAPAEQRRPPAQNAGPVPSPAGGTSRFSGRGSAQTLQPVPSSSAVESVPDRVLSLLRQDRFHDALAVLESPCSTLATRETRSPTLLYAAVLTHLGRYAEARRECTLLLDKDDHGAGAHFLLGLSHEQAGELPEAEDHMRQATYLDPGFALPQLHRGLLAVRLNAVPAARAAFARAMRAFQNEDEARMALFAGSLTRQSFQQLCMRELERLPADYSDEPDEPDEPDQPDQPEAAPPAGKRSGGA